MVNKQPLHCTLISLLLSLEMQVPFADPVSAFLLFLQSLFLYLHYATVGFWADDHWGVYFLPLFVGLIFVVAMMASEALFEGRKRMVQGLTDASQTTMSHVLFQMLTGVTLLFTLVLFVFYLDEDTDLPLYWITTSFFVACILFAATLLIIYHKKEHHHIGPSKVYIFVSILAFTQGLFLWLYNSPWGCVMCVAPWIIGIPFFLFLAASFYRTLMQTYQKRNDPGPNMIKQFGFLFLILMVAYEVLATVIYLANPDIAWVQPQWILLPFMIYTVLLFTSSVYVYWSTTHPEEEKKLETYFRPPPTAPSYTGSPADFSLLRSDEAFLQSFGDRSSHIDSGNY